VIKGFEAVTTNPIIPSSFFERPVLDVCPELIGHFLVIKTVDGQSKHEITEIEAYDGPEDRACHGSKGRTARTEVLFGPAGRWYVYLCYGVHWLLNVVTGPVEYPAAILIRGVGEWGGPGILTRELGIDKKFNTLPATQETGLWIEFNSERSKPYPYQTGPRIGVDYAGEWAAKPYRYLKSTIQ
jgi:DNA-3-methyladenine glycosylase